MSESRGAASVTLDTIIANALSETFDRWANTVGSGEGLTESLARAVTDALLAKGRTRTEGYYKGGKDHELHTEFGLWIPLEAS